ncbi:MAG: DUF4153 domain-containing protein, partial [Actinomycetota bacterium]
AFGFTRDRLAGHAVTIWLAGIFALILISGAFGLGRRLPVAFVVFTAAALLSFAVYNPDARIAGANVGRFEKTGKVDMDYLSTLSSDAATQLLRLPPELRSCLRIDKPLKGDWRSFNFSRRAADKLLAETGGTCTPEHRGESVT